MTTYKICNKCKNFVEVKYSSRLECGNEIIEYTCPKCGYIDRQIINKVHYGNDAIKK